MKQAALDKATSINLLTISTAPQHCIWHSQQTKAQPRRLLLLLLLQLLPLLLMLQLLPLQLLPLLLLLLLLLLLSYALTATSGATTLTTTTTTTLQLLLNPPKARCQQASSGGCTHANATCSSTTLLLDAYPPSLSQPKVGTSIGDPFIANAVHQKEQFWSDQVQTVLSKGGVTPPGLQRLLQLGNGCRPEKNQP